MCDDPDDAPYREYDEEWETDEGEEQDLALSNEEDGESHDVLIIPGDAMMPEVGLIPRRKRPLTMQLLVAAMAVSLIVSASFTFSPLSDTSATMVDNPFAALANAINLNSRGPWVPYRARVGDTFGSIAARFGLTTPNGIYELNDLYITDEPEIGREYKIPTDPRYGATFQPPLPPGLNIYGNVYPLANIIIPGTTSQFAAVAGASNGAGGNCAPNWETIQSSGDITQYHLINPDQPPAGSPASHWGRGFLPPSVALPGGHDGLDISSGVEGTPLYAAQAGQVIFASWDIGGGGLTIKMNHCGGLATSYSHMDKMLVGVGANVKQGQIIGYQGITGDAQGTHVHYMLWWHNTPIDGLCAYTATNKLDGYYLGNDPVQRPPYGGCPPNLTPSKWLVR
jgi:murein DD-endopeptidase MepM/ murein hydrolase activator NlpD